MELSPEKQTVSDVYRTDTFRYAIRPVHESRIQQLAPEQRRRARAEDAIIIGFGGLLALIQDLRQNRRPYDRRRLAAPHWSSTAHGWVFR